jgi:hypothetical protein
MRGGYVLHTFPHTFYPKAQSLKADKALILKGNGDVLREESDWYNF